MAKEVLDETRDKSYSEQQRILNERLNLGAPKLRDVVAAVVAHYVSTGNRLLSDNPYRYTRCQEQVVDGCDVYQAVAGGFSADGLLIDFYDFDFEGVGLLPLEEVLGS